MHQNYAKQSNNSSSSNQDYHPITMSFNNKIPIGKEKQINFNGSIKKIKKQNYEKDSKDLLNQLFFLLGNQQVIKNMSIQLQQRVKNVIAAAEDQQDFQNQLNTNQDKNLFSQKKQFECNDQTTLKRLKQIQLSNLNKNIDSKHSIKPNKTHKLEKIPITLQTFAQLQLPNKQLIKNKENFQCRSELNLKNNSQSKSKKNLRKLNENSLSKDKKKPEYTANTIRVNGSQKMLSKNVKGYLVSSSSKPNIKIVQLRSKSKDRYLKQQKNSKNNEKSQKNLNINHKKVEKIQQKTPINTIKRFHTESNKNPCSFTTTQFTTRNCQADIKLIKQSLTKNQSKQKNPKAKIKKLKTDHSLQKNKSKNCRKQNQRHYTEKQQDSDQKIIFYDDAHSDQQLFQNSPYQYLRNIYQSNGKFNKYSEDKKDKYDVHKQNQQKQSTKEKQRIVSQSYKEIPPEYLDQILQQPNSIQFIYKIFKLQKQAKRQEQELENKIKSIKNNIYGEKYTLQNVKNQISKLKQEQNNIQINNAFLTNKKNENHKKLEHIWTEVKNLNNSILQSNQQNEQVLSNLQEEKQLVQMYNTVIQQLKQQLKIQIDQRDQYKKMLKQSKKSQVASKIKANSTKQKTQLILGNVRQSINKWI